MAGGVPLHYRESAANKRLASYDYFDIASGTGVKTFYLGRCVDKWVMSESKFYSELVSEIDDTDHTSFAKVKDIDYDVQFTQPRSIEGQTVANIPMCVFVLVDAKTCECYVVIRLKKVHDGVEEEITTNQSVTITQRFTGTNSGYHRAVACVDLDIPLTHLGSGDYLRTTVELWTKSESGGNASFMIGQDPWNRAKDEITNIISWGTEPSVATVQIPFKLDI